MADHLNVGIDIGSTWVKALACTVDGAVEQEARRSTPWVSGPGGTAELDAEHLAVLASELLAEVTSGGATIDGIGVSGMAESGVVLRDDRVLAPIIAWFDPRGADALAAASPELRRQVPAVTGLPLTAMASVWKLQHLRTAGLDLRGGQWLSVPEFVVHRLGGVAAAETSLLARTGLLDQEAGVPWADALDLLGVDAGFVPEIRSAGTSWGTHPGTGAALSVAGHDHLVASLAAHVTTPDTVYVSMGTAEALVRPVDGLLDAASRERLAADGIDVVRHVLPGRGVILAGVKTGLLLRRVLQLVGVNDAVGREAMDAAVLALPAGAERLLVVGGAHNDDGVLQVRADVDGLSPAHLFAATLAHADDEVGRLLALIDEVAGPATHSVVSGGWSRMASVQAARRRVLPDPTFSPRSEDTAVGAALVGACAAAGDPDLGAFIRATHHPHIP